MELRTIERETAEAHYAEHAEKPFFGPVVDFITSGPVVALVAEGERAIEAFRGLAGATDPVKALPGTIRGDYCSRGRREHGARLRLPGVSRPGD